MGAEADVDRHRNAIQALQTKIAAESRKVATVRDDGSELAIHAMAMRSKYQRLLPGE